MPLSINVGLSRKASRDYQSTGVSINVTAELDQSLLAKPAELQAQIDALYNQAESAIDRQVQAYGAENAPSASAQVNGNRFRGNGHADHRNGNGHRPVNGNGHRNGGGMTTSQRRAILAIADRAHLDADQEAHDLFGAGLDDLTIRQASGFIDHLKEQVADTGGKNGNGRH